MRILHSKKLIFVSKPRCGSLSLREFLDFKMQPGDEKCDWASEYPELHPHMPAAAIHHYLDRKGIDASKYKTFTVTRNPVDMLWSYFKYFRPDENGFYNYDQECDPTKPVNFEKWLTTGNVRIDENWRAFIPSFIKSSDFSPLSLEAHIFNLKGQCVADRYFRLDDLGQCEDWLEEIFSEPVKLPCVNSSSKGKIPHVSPESLSGLKAQFPLEMRMWKHNLDDVPAPN